MLDFETQKQFLQPILKNPKNYLCADCDAISPTWASIDFGVFLCSNCSGAHRALGPTITRVRSANLDKWQQDWLSNMKIGNSQLNRFWESNPQAAYRKPKTGSDLNQVKRYVYQKYVKRKFVANINARDPLTLFKSGQYEISNLKQPKSIQTKPIDKIKQVVPILSHTQSLNSEIKNTKNNFDLLDFNFIHTPSQGKQVGKKVQQDQEFTEFTHIGAVGSTKNEKSNENDFICFDTLLNNQKQPQVQQNNYNNHCSYQSLKSQNLQFHHPYNPQIAQQNLVYQNHYQAQYNQHGYMSNYTGQQRYGLYGYPSSNQSNGLWF